MKKKCFLLSVFFLLCCTACNKPAGGDPHSVAGNGTENPVTLTSSDNIHLERMRDDYSADECMALTAELPNIRVSEDFRLIVPKGIDHVSDFHIISSSPLTSEEHIAEFRNMFVYLFPDHELDENCFQYIYNTIEDGYFQQTDGIVSMDYDLLTSGKGQIQILQYLEYDTDKEHQVALVCQSPLGNGVFIMNCGVSAMVDNKISGVNGIHSELFKVSDEYSTYIGEFYPDSEEKFMLLDKEITIKDAVQVFKDFVDCLPCSIEPAFAMNVNKVYVYKINASENKDLHYLEFNTSRMYDGIPFSYIISGNSSGDTGDMGQGGMIKSDDVDYIYATWKTDRVFDETEYTEIVPPAQALKIVSEKMTQNVEFELKDIKLIYQYGDDLDNDPWIIKYYTRPKWHITLYNPNDNFYYKCYVDCLTGDFHFIRSN